MPKRLMDLTYDYCLKVFNSEDLLEAGIFDTTGPEYCTLSYCWGDTPHSCILADIFDVFLHLPLASVPKTFQDAVQVARQPVSSIFG